MSSQQIRLGDLGRGSKNDDPDGSRNSRKYKKRDWLYKEYVNNERLIKDIAEECGVAGGTISTWLGKFDIPTRDRSEIINDPYKYEDNQHRDKEWLKEQYLEKEKSQKEISEECDASPQTIGRWLKKLNIPRRPHPNEKYKDKKYRDKEWLFEQHIENEKSRQEIAKLCDVVPGTISNWMNKFDIPQRENNSEPCSFYLSGRTFASGYPTWAATGKNADIGYLTVHRLVAVANGADPYKVFSDSSYQVHHRNGFKCDNRPQNIELVDSRTHGRHHSPDSVKWTDDDLEFAIRYMMNPTKYMATD